MSQTRIPTLDGWRGIAILMVLVDHVIFTLWQRYPRPWMRTGMHGVTLFFVLSGFLITSNLLSEPIHLKKFYIRRFFRLIPTAWTFLAIMLLLHWTIWTEVRGCLLFYRNFQGHLGVAGHFWSLSIEEQFYLVWPTLLLLLGVRRCRWIALGGAVIVAVFRAVFWAHYESGLLYTRTEVRADALLIGCLFALLIHDPNWNMRLASWSKACALPAAILFIAGIGFFHVLQPAWECVAIGTLLVFTSQNPNNIAARFLAWGPLERLGAISYAIYVWQEPFTGFHGISFFFACAILFMPTVLASHYLIERPMRTIGRRIAGRESRRKLPEAVLAE